MQRRSSFFALLTFACLSVLGCRSGADVDRSLIAEVLTASEVSPNLRAICIPGGRLSGSPNGEKAEQLIADKLHEYGLSNIHFEPFTMTTWQDRRTEVSLLDDPPVTLEPAQSLGNCLSTPPDGITGELVDVGVGVDDDFKAKAAVLPGRFALAHDGGPHRGRKMRSALQYGAIGLLLASDSEDQVVVGNCHDGPKPQPGVAITKAAGDKLAARLAVGETVKVNVKIDADAWECRPRNVVGEIPGSGPLAKEVILLGAHLDSWHLAEGALDNGTGSATILEVARAMMKTGWHPRRTVRFVWFMGEEHGLLGSEAYVEQHKAELDRLIAMVNMDMAGEPRSFVVYGHPEAIGPVKTVCDRLRGYEVSCDLVEARGAGSDHASFMNCGVCCIALHGEMGPGVKYYHTASDTYDQVDRRSLNAAAAALAVLVRHLADSPLPAHRLPQRTGEPASQPASQTKAAR
jgi:Iap family predicted aminopeptidase